MAMRSSTMWHCMLGMACMAYIQMDLDRAAVPSTACFAGTATALHVLQVPLLRCACHVPVQCSGSTRDVELRDAFVDGVCVDGPAVVASALEDGVGDPHQPVHLEDNDVTGIRKGFSARCYNSDVRQPQAVSFDTSWVGWAAVGRQSLYATYILEGQVCVFACVRTALWSAFFFFLVLGSGADHVPSDGITALA